MKDKSQGSSNDTCLEAGGYISATTFWTIRERFRERIYLDDPAFVGGFPYNDTNVGEESAKG